MGLGPAYFNKVECAHRAGTEAKVEKMGWTRGIATDLLCEIWEGRRERIRNI